MKNGLHRHLRRLPEVFQKHPIYFITTCTHHRLSILTEQGVAEILVSEYQSASARHQWFVGRYVIMPDHVHFFASPGDASKSLSGFMNSWKEWTSKRIRKLKPEIKSVWQNEFFDHLLRDPRSYQSKWEYVWQNPVRAGLVVRPGDWPYQGEIHILE